VSGKREGSGSGVRVREIEKTWRASGFKPRINPLEKKEKLFGDFKANKQDVLFNP